MKHNQIRPAKGAVKKRTRRGRGNASGLGGEAGRGHKGQKARSGGSIRPGFEGGQTPLYRRLPKRRGFNNNEKIIYVPINLGDIDKHFGDGEVVDHRALSEKGLVRKKGVIKVLGSGDLTKKLTIQASKFSKSALEKIKKSGSSSEVLS